MDRDMRAAQPDGIGSPELGKIEGMPERRWEGRIMRDLPSETHTYVATGFCGGYACA